MSEDTRMLQQLCWFLLIVSIAWFFVAIATTMIVFCFTTNPYSLYLFPTLTSPVIGYLGWILKPLLPMNEKRYKLAEKKLELKMRKTRDLHDVSLKDVVA
jgi:hypothetical protein